MQLRSSKYELFSYFNCKNFMVDRQLFLRGVNLGFMGEIVQQQILDMQVFIEEE